MNQEEPVQRGTLSTQLAAITSRTAAGGQSLSTPGDNRDFEKEMAVLLPICVGEHIYFSLSGGSICREEKEKHVPIFSRATK